MEIRIIKMMYVTYIRKEQVQECTNAKRNTQNKLCWPGKIYRRDGSKKAFKSKRATQWVRNLTFSVLEEVRERR